MIFTVDPDIRKARTLPSEFYTDPRYLELSKEKIFARTWQFAAGPELNASLTPFTLLPRYLNEPLLLVQSTGEIRCLSNVCTHRGKLLIEDACDGNLILCGYHGRRFSLDGKFLSMPEFEGVADFPSDDEDLKKIALTGRDGFTFVSLDPPGPFETFVAGWPENLDLGALRFAGRRAYEVDAHWALYCENYLEGFHIPFVHKSLNAVVDYGSYTTDLFRYSSLQKGYDATGVVAARYLFVFPNLMFNFYPWGISVNIVRPVTPSQSVVEFLTYVGDESLIETGAGADLHGVEMEDEAVVESVQKGIRSRYYSIGRYSPKREQGTHHFHRLISEFIA